MTGVKKMGMQKQVRVSALYQNGTQMRYVATVKAMPPLAGSTARANSSSTMRHGSDAELSYSGFISEASRMQCFSFGTAARPRQCQPCSTTLIAVASVRIGVNTNTAELPKSETPVDEAVQDSRALVLGRLDGDGATSDF